MEFARKHKDRLIEAYTVELKSTYQIAEELGTYANKVRKSLDFLGVPRRGYKEAQQISLETGRSVHPTAGKEISKEHKRRIGRARAKAWSEISDQERARLSQISKDQWARMAESDKAELRRLASEAVRESSKIGSQTERYIQSELRKLGYTVNFHVKGLIANSNLELDLFLPELRTAIEIDGPAHFLPIWGEEKLQKHQAADADKEGLLMQSGYVLIRVKQMDQSMSESKMEKILEILIVELKKIEDKFPPKSKRIIEIEVKNGKIAKQ